jgi:glycosyltransferase involved in cell wall biosynthesis
MGDRLADLRLVLFFTRGLSLRVWDEIGILSREAALYRRLRPALRRITFVTYGDRDHGYAGRLGGLGLQCNRWHLRRPLYERYLRHILPWSWIGPVVVKSNQVEGADLALAAARLRKAPFVARCGFLPSDNMRRAYGEDSTQTKSARALERDVFRGADRVVVTTAAIRDTIVHRYQLRPDRVRVIPNYVDTVVFAPDPAGASRPKQLLYVGRLEEEKNPRALLDAIAGLDVELLVVGKGSLGEALARDAAVRRLRVTFLGNLPNDQLPRLLNSSAAFVMPSLIEGHPKALLEAMACGRPVIGTNVPGIRELITDRVTGVLCEPTSKGLSAAISEVLGQPARSAAMGSAARSDVAGRFSLEQVVKMELALLDELTAERSGSRRVLTSEGVSESLVLAKRADRLHE